MFRINHNDEIELEHEVRRLYGCDRGGVSGMADADYFEGHPIQAAVLVVSYIHAIVRMPHGNFVAKCAGSQADYN